LLNCQNLLQLLVPEFLEDTSPEHGPESRPQSTIDNDIDSDMSHSHKDDRDGGTSGDETNSQHCHKDDRDGGTSGDRDGGTSGDDRDGGTSGETSTPNRSCIPWVVDPPDCRLHPPDTVQKNDSLEEELNVDSVALRFPGLKFYSKDRGEIIFQLALVQNEWAESTTVLKKIRATKAVVLRIGDENHTPYLHGSSDTSRAHLRQYFRVVEGAVMNIEMYLNDTDEEDPIIAILDTGRRHRAPNLLACAMMRLAGTTIAATVHIINEKGKQANYTLSSQVGAVSCTPCTAIFSSHSCLYGRGKGNILNSSMTMASTTSTSFVLGFQRAPKHLRRSCPNTSPRVQVLLVSGVVESGW
jgi:hypothetical protein